MNQIEKDIEVGKNIIRKEGMTFNKFKEEVSSLLVNSKKIDEDHWVMLYEFYAEGRAHYVETVKEWASEHFQDFTLEKHELQLKN